jgi:ferredoxin
MHVHADRQACQGYMLCVFEAPEVFDVDDTGTVVITSSTPTDDLRTKVERAISVCPARALSLTEHP